jgi:hypothetical protein
LAAPWIRAWPRELMSWSSVCRGSISSFSNTWFQGGRCSVLPSECSRTCFL